MGIWKPQEKLGLDRQTLESPAEMVWKPSSQTGLLFERVEESGEAMIREGILNVDWDSTVPEKMIREVEK